MFCAVLPSALASGIPSIQPPNGFLTQPAPEFMNAAVIPDPSDPTILKSVTATNLEIHQQDELKIGSTTYMHAHRLLLQHLKMMERQSKFSKEELAKFNGSTHPDILTKDLQVTPPDNSPTTGIFIPVFTSTDVIDLSSSLRTYLGNRPSRRTIISDLEARNKLLALLH